MMLVKCFMISAHFLKKLVKYALELFRLRIIQELQFTMILVIFFDGALDSRCQLISFFSVISVVVYVNIIVVVHHEFKLRQLEKEY